MTRRRKQTAAAALLGVAALAAGYHFARRTHRREPETVLPAFTDPAGPRAPTYAALGFELGKTRLDDALAGLEGRGVACRDTGMRALMRRAREQKKADLDAKKARGEDVDVVSGASANRPSPREKNPQVRLSCEDVPASALTDRERPDVRGRLLLVFDSPDHPLRHVSFTRTYADHQAALADYEATRSATTARFGDPDADVVSKPGDGAAGDPHELARFEQHAERWRFGDLEAKVLVFNYSRKGVTVTEAVEVPWPVRADAPAMAKR